MFCLTEIAWENPKIGDTGKLSSELLDYIYLFCENNFSIVNIFVTRDLSIKNNNTDQFFYSQ